MNARGLSSRLRAPSERLRRFGLVFSAYALACSPIKRDTPQGRCDRPGAFTCASAPSRDVLECGSDGYWTSSGRCPGRQMCAMDSPGGQAACRDPLDECVDKSADALVCRGSEVHACGPDWVSTFPIELCGGETPACFGGQCVECLPDERRCNEQLPELCSPAGEWVEQPACPSSTPVCAQGRCVPEDSFVTSCRAAGASERTEIEWLRAPTLGGFTYRVKAITGLLTAPGWTLRHRPALGFPDNYFEPDVSVTGSAIIDYPVWSGLVPSANAGLGAPAAPLSILTCPDGTCVASPVRNECKTLYDFRGDPENLPRRIAVVGDTLLQQNQVCSDPPAPDFCAPSLESKLKEWGFRSWVEYHDGQGSYAWLNVVREQATTRPDVMIIAVAMHDAIRQANASGAERERERAFTQSSLQAALRVIHENNPEGIIVLVTASERGAGDYRAEASFVNTVIRNADLDPTIQQNLWIADWDVLTRNLCGDSWVSDPLRTCDLFDPDQLHLQGAGDNQRNTLIVFAAAYGLREADKAKPAAAQNEAR
ncbi:MAG TPA: hypothetical protein VK524_22735 [Polyangiaceae bacterium]|nr:hypothetical protein [Polyangiaceae bacterium]